MIKRELKIEGDKLHIVETITTEKTISLQGAIQWYNSHLKEIEQSKTLLGEEFQTSEKEKLAENTILSEQIKKYLDEMIETQKKTNAVKKEAKLVPKEELKSKDTKPAQTGSEKPTEGQ